MAWQKKQDRQNAIRVIRSYMRQNGIAPERQSGKTAVVALDEFSRLKENWNHRTAKWYVYATDNQIILFIKDWNDWCKSVLIDQGKSGRRSHDKDQTPF